MPTTSEIRYDAPEFVGSSLSFGDVDDVLLVCHGRGPLRELEWQVLLQRIAVPDFGVMLVSTLGGGPLPAQRNELVHCFAEAQRHAPRIAVLSASTGMRWVHAAMRFLSQLDATTLAFDAMRDGVRFLECRAPADRLQLARARAHYLIEKRAVGLLPAREHFMHA